MRLILLIVCALLLFQCQSEKKRDKLFTITGTIQGVTTKELVLFYVDSLDQRIADTLSIIDGKFEFKGHINNPQRVSLSGNVKEISYDNPNVARFYLGYDDVFLNLVEDKFNKTKVKGSSIQDNYVSFLKENEILQEQMTLVYNEKMSLYKKILQGDNTDANKNKYNDLNIQHEILLDSMMSKQLNYVNNNLASYISLDILKLYQTDMEKEVFGTYFKNFEDEIKESFQAKKIVEFLQSDEIPQNYKLADVGTLAPLFEAETYLGDKINLVEFRGKYVLLDFWATWCAPCLKNNPELKRLYKKFKPYGFDIVGVSLDIDKKAWKAKIKEEELVWHQIFTGTENQMIKSPIINDYSIGPIPAYVLIDKNGFIIGRYLSADLSNNKTMKDLENDLNKLFL
jgi:peroxiredoxin